MLYLIVCAGAMLVAWIVFRRDYKLRHIPGPRRRWFYDNTLDMDIKRPRLAFENWHNQYGDIIRVSLTIGDVVVVSGFDNLYEMFVTKGQQFGGRPDLFRNSYVVGNSGILYRQPDKVWKALRKIVHGHIKQFGTGLSTLENHISAASEPMFDSFRQQAGVPFDPLSDVSAATMFVLCRLIISPSIVKTDAVFQKLIKLMPFIMRALDKTSTEFRILDYFPFLIHLPLASSEKVKNARQYILDIWSDMKSCQTNEADSLVSVFMKQVTSDQETFIAESYVVSACFELLAAGQATTTATFYAIIHILGHVTCVQNAVYEEIDAVTQRNNESISLKHKPEMPYTQAFIYETLRCFSAAPTASTHIVIEEDVSLPTCEGIPKGTTIFPNVWRLHHDELFWGDPDVFRPERFLDDHGQLLSASDPKRKHLMPFGAGSRVCVAEIFALSRIFIWTTQLLEKFQILPDPQSSKINWMDPNIHPQGNVLMPLPYKVIFSPRV